MFEGAISIVKERFGKVYVDSPSYEIEIRDDRFFFHDKEDSGLVMLIEPTRVMLKNDIHIGPNVLWRLGFEREKLPYSVSLEFLENKGGKAVAEYFDDTIKEFKLSPEHGQVILEETAKFLEKHIDFFEWVINYAKEERKLMNRIKRKIADLISV